MGDPIIKALSFFRSAICCGERWGAGCDEVYEEALAELARLYAERDEARRLVRRLRPLVGDMPAALYEVAPAEADQAIARWAAEADNGGGANE